MIRRPPSTTRTTHSFPTRRSSDLLDYHKGIETGQGIITSGAYKGVLANSRMNKASTPFGVLKYLDEEERAKTQERNHSDTDYIILRLGEVLLKDRKSVV